MLQALRHAILLLSAALCLCGPAAAQALTPDEAAAIAFAEERGRLIFAYDQAAWVTTDDLLPRLRDPQASGLAGWVVEPNGEALSVTFVRQQGEGLSAMYRADVRGRSVSNARLLDGDETALTEAQSHLLRARDLVTAPTNPCTNAPYNTVSIGGADGAVDVYLLSAWTDARNFPIGGHHRFTVGADGAISSQRRFTNSCLNMAVNPNGPRDDEAGLMITHLLDPTPTEIHVFLSLTARMPIYVAASDRLWQVNGASIELVEDPDR
jgi:hypothetical protein